MIPNTLYRIQSLLCGISLKSVYRTLIPQFLYLGLLSSSNAGCLTEITDSVSIPGNTADGNFINIS
jgi:hypothetical protein